MSDDPIDDQVQNWEVEIRRGVIQLLVLNVLSQRDYHGRAITDKIYEMTKGKIEVPIGTIYPLLSRFNSEGFIESYKADGDQRKTIYTLTSKGNRYYEQVTDRWLRYSITLSDALHFKHREEQK